MDLVCEEIQSVQVKVEKSDHIDCGEKTNQGASESNMHNYEYDNKTKLNIVNMDGIKTERSDDYDIYGDERLSDTQIYKFEVQKEPSLTRLIGRITKCNKPTGQKRDRKKKSKSAKQLENVIEGTNETNKINSEYRNITKKATKSRVKQTENEIDTTKGYERIKLESSDKSIEPENETLKKDKSFRCDICEKEFRRSGDLSCHKRIHLDKSERQFVCDVCYKRFAFRKDLRRHEVIHTGIRPFVCPVCSRSFALKHTLKAHALTHAGVKNFICDQCDKSFLRKHQLKSHKELRHRTKPDMTKSSDQSCCQTTFETLEDYQRHREMVHVALAVVSLECIFCRQEHKTESELRTHIEMHIQDPNYYSCEACGSVFDNDWALQVHKTAHKAQHENIECPLCAQQITQRSHLRYHLQRRHKIESTMKDCPLCNEKDTFDDIITHILNKHVELPLVPCVVCLKSYTTLSSMLRHTRSQSDAKQTCHMCKCQFDSCADVIDHVNCHAGLLNDPKLQHEQKSKTKSFICDQCGKGFAKRSRLADHVLSHGSKSRDFVCQICGKGFSRERTLTIHLRRKHEGKQEYHACDVCGKLLQNSGNLKRHLLTHQGLKPFSCSVCDKHFTQKSSLRDHELIHSRLKPHACACGKSFRQRSNFSTHAKRCKANVEYGVTFDTWEDGSFKYKRNVSDMNETRLKNGSNNSFDSLETIAVGDGDIGNGIKPGSDIIARVLDSVTKDGLTTAPRSANTSALSSIPIICEYNLPDREFILPDSQLCNQVSSSKAPISM